MTHDECLKKSVARCQAVMSHAWMVRTFVKHSPEVEDFPELMEVVRTVFDMSRALETRIDDPAGYFNMLRKKIGKLRKTAEKFGHDAPLASGHTNFKQAVESLTACVTDLEEILAAVTSIAPVRGGPNESSENGKDSHSPSNPVPSIEVQEDQME